MWSIAAGGGVFCRIKRRIADQTADWHSTSGHRETADLASDCCILCCYVYWRTSCLEIVEKTGPGHL